MTTDRRARTRGALVAAAQAFLAEGRTSVPVLEITEAAGVGTGSFYNHFATKEELFAAALDDALEQQAALLDALATDVDDPAVVFAQGFRLTGRLHRLAPRLSQVILATGLDHLDSTSGHVGHARRDVAAAVDAGRFTVPDLDVAMVSVVGAALVLGRMLHDRPELDDAATTDAVTRDVLRVLGLDAAEAERICALPLPSLSPPPLTHPS